MDRAILTRPGPEPDENGGFWPSVVAELAGIER